MKNQLSHTDPPHGARFTLLLIPLFAAAALAMLGIVYPMLIGDALQAQIDAAPLANPQLTVTSDTGDALYAEEQTLSRLSAIGNPVAVVRYDTETVDGLRIRLLATEDTALEDSFVLTEGRMPQNRTECVIVGLVPASPDIASAVSGTDIGIGSAIRPCGKNGEVLTDNQTGTPCCLTVVGIGENVLSALAPITDSTVQLLVYTADDPCWQNPDTTDCLYLTDCSTDDPAAAVSAIASETAAARDAYRIALAEQRITAAAAAAKEADNAVIAHEITVQTVENRLNTANLRVSEAETNMMDAVAALQAEQQEFVSDMEYNEYYALRQVDLIPRRDRAEEGYAKQEEVIAQMNETLHAAYAERDAIAVELQHAADVLAGLQAEATTAHTALRQLQTQNEQGAQMQSWSITAADAHPAYVRLRAHAAAVRNTALLLCAAALGIYLVGSITAYAVSHRVTCSVTRALLSAIPVTVPAVLFGGCVLSAPIFAHAYPALQNTITLPLSFSELLPAGAAVLLLTVIISAGTAAIGCRLQHIQLTAKNQ